MEIPDNENAISLQGLALTTDLRYGHNLVEQSFLQRLCQKVKRAFPGVGGVIGAVGLFVG